MSWLNYLQWLFVGTHTLPKLPVWRGKSIGNISLCFKSLRHQISSVKIYPPLESLVVWLHSINRLSNLFCIKWAAFTKITWIVATLNSMKIVEPVWSKMKFLHTDSNHNSISTPLIQTCLLINPENLTINSHPLKCFVQTAVNLIDSFLHAFQTPKEVISIQGS